MDIFWAAIVAHGYKGQTDDKGAAVTAIDHPFTKYVYGRISENYRRVFEEPSGAVANMPLRYRQCLLLTDMISGMTDSFAVALHNELTSLQGEFDASIVLGERK